jgi:hypothetical protein
MASQYSPLLRFELIASGEQAGLWGNTTNNTLGTVLEQAIAGVSFITLSSTADYTLTTTNGTPDEARAATLMVGGTPGGAANVIVPALQKQYIVRNTTPSTITVKTSAQVGGVSILAGLSAVVFCDGTDVYAGTSINSSTSGGANKIPQFDGLGSLGITAAPNGGWRYSGSNLGSVVQLTSSNAIYTINTATFISCNAYITTANAVKSVAAGAAAHVEIAPTGLYFQVSNTTPSAADQTVVMVTKMSVGETGNMTLSGTLTQLSDRRVKTDIEPIRDALDKVRRLVGITYKRTDWDGTLPREMGLIAQDVLAVAPEVVRENDEKMLTVSYANLVALLVEAIKHIDTRLSALEGST